MMTQSKSPRSKPTSLAGSTRRARATVVRSASAMALRRVEGRAGSFSRIVRRISSRPAASNSLVSKGGWPVNSSYSSTPRL